MSHVRLPEVIILIFRLVFCFVLMSLTLNQPPKFFHGIYLYQRVFWSLIKKRAVFVKELMQLFLPLPNLDQPMGGNQTIAL